MTIKQFKKLRQNLHICMDRNMSFNPVVSVTDPTQVFSIGDLYRATAAGTPIDVAEQKMHYNGLDVDHLTPIEKRGYDKFDVHTEFRKDDRSLRNGIKDIYKHEKLENHGKEG